MNNFCVFKASAGSGKTTQLVTEYLSLAFQESKRYRNILAITFTNNATAEMKERIIQTLYTFAFKDENSFSNSDKKTYDTILDRLKGKILKSGMTPRQFVSTKAREILNNILYDYDNFSISTIDSFFQRILRAFALEFGLNINFNLEISLDELYEQAINLLINKLSKENTELTFKIENLVDDQLDEKGKWKIERKLISTVQTIFQEETATALSLLESNMTAETLKEISKDYKKKRKELGEIIRTNSDSLTQLICEKGWATKKRTNIKTKARTACDFEDFLEIFITQTKNSLQESDKDELNGYYQNIQESSVMLKKLNFIHGNIDRISIMFDLKEIINEIRHRDNLFYLSETNNLISKQIEDDDTPYIYEKIGNKYAYYFIDEFQDTSKLQWENLIPIVQNALAGTTINDTMGEVKLFGDIKQAIYRFRNGDATLLHNLSSLEGYKEQIAPTDINGEFFSVNSELNTNYRSTRSIVNFNNEFFKYFVESLNNEKCQNFYADVKQQIKPNAEEGFVSIQFKDEEDKMSNEDFFISETEKTIQLLTENNIPLQDVAILCSSNSLVSAIGQHLAGKGYAVISQEALQLSQSDKIQTLIATLKFIDNPKDTIQKFIIFQQITKDQAFSAEQFHQNIKKITQSQQDFLNLLKEYHIDICIEALQTVPLYTRIHKLIETFNFHLETDIFLITFLDLVDKYVNNNNFDTSKFIEWWEKNGAQKSIASPQGMDAVTISTIHKSKGLAYPYVIFPFSRYAYKKTKEEIWLKNNDYTKNSDKTLPVFLAKLKKDDVPSEFAHYEAEEGQLSVIDAVNKIYVAHTRPKKGLFIITESKTSGNYSKVINNFIKNFEDSPNCNPIFFYNYKFQKARPEIHSESKGESEFPTITTPYCSDFAPDRSHLVLDTLEESEAIKKGNFIHNTLSTLQEFPQTEEEILTITGCLDDDYKELITNILSEFIQCTELRPYFSKEVKSLNETPILTPEGKVYRPDRIVFLESGEVAVMDYKSGEPNEKYKEQITNYCELIKKMGYEQVSAYIIYLQPFNYEKII